MKNTNKIISAVVALTIATAGFTACGSNDASKAKSSSKSLASELTESYDVASADVVNDIDKAYRNALDTFQMTRYVDDNYIITPSVKVDPYYYRRDTDQGAIISTSFVYDQKLYYVDCPTRSGNSYESGIYLSCASLDGELLNAYFISENRNLKLKAEWVDDKGNFLLIMNETATEPCYLFYLDTSSGKVVQLDTEIDYNDVGHVAGFYDGKICMVSPGTIQLADTDTFTFTDYVTDTDVGGNSIVIGKYLIDSDTVYDLDKKQAVIQLESAYSDYDEETGEIVEVKSDYEEYFGDDDGGMYQRVYDGIFLREENYYYEWSDDHTKLLKYVRNKDYFVRDDKSEYQVVYSSPNGEIDGYRLINDDYVYIYDEGEGFIYNTNTGEQLEIKSDCQWFEYLYDIYL